MNVESSSHARSFALASLIFFVTGFVNTSVIDRSKREFAIHKRLESVDEPQNEDSSFRGSIKVRETGKVLYNGAQLWRVRANEDQVGPVSNSIAEYLDAGLFSPWSSNDTTADLMVRSDDIPRMSRYLKEKDVRYDVVIEDLQKAIDEENPPLTEEMMDELEGRKGHRMEWSSYHRLQDIYGYIDYLADTFPDLCSVVTIGNSAEGRPLNVLRISNGNPNAPAMWIDGGIHAREWISPAVVTYIINYLVENSEGLATDYYILPVVNPDGYEYTFERDRLWRKNRRLLMGNCKGVDLNRNFGYRWGGLGTSKDPCRDIYAGTGPFSESETNAIRNFFEASAANFKAYLTFHSYGQYILYPWGYDRRVPPDYADLEKVGKEAAMAMKKAGGAGSVYTVGNSATTLYAASGGADDWAKAILKIKYAYTVELRDTGRSGFILPARYIIPTAKEGLAIVEVVADACKKL